MITRYLSSAAAGIAVTTALLCVMHYLIEVSEAVVQPPKPRPNLTLGKTIDDSPVKPKDTIPPPPPPPVEPPPTVPPREPASGAPTIGVRVPAPVPVGDDFGVTDVYYTDSALINIIAVQPHYPVPAAQKGLEGYVIVKFDVTEIGTVTNVVVVESSSRLFNKAATDAAYKFRYKAKTVDGVPLVTHGVRKLFRFEMED